MGRNRDKFAILYDKGDSFVLLISNIQSPKVTFYDDLEKIALKHEEIIGRIKFKSSKSPLDIINGFSDKYIGKEKMENLFKRDAACSYVTYPSSFKPTLPEAFVNYFS